MELSDCVRFEKYKKLLTSMDGMVTLERFNVLQTRMDSCIGKDELDRFKIDLAKTTGELQRAIEPLATKWSVKSSME